MTVKLRIFLASWLFLNILSCLAGAAEIDIDQQNFGSESIKEPAKKSPFSFEAHADAVAGSKINRGFYKGDEVHFAEAEADLGFVFYYCPAYTEGARIALSYTTTYLRWSENPYFNQDRFHVVSLNFTGFTQRFDRRFWRTRIFR